MLFSEQQTNIIITYYCQCCSHNIIYLPSPTGLLLFAWFTGSPVNGSIYSLSIIWSYSISSFNWFWIYSCIFFAFLPTVSTWYPRHPKYLFPYLYFKFTCLSNIINVLFPFRYPTKLDTLILGGNSASICTWSGQFSASIIFTPFHLHSVLNIRYILFSICYLPSIFRRKYDMIHWRFLFVRLNNCGVTCIAGGLLKDAFTNKPL